MEWWKVYHQKKSKKYIPYSAHSILTERAKEEKMEINPKKKISAITVIDKEIIIQVSMIFFKFCI